MPAFLAAFWAASLATPREWNQGFRRRRSAGDRTTVAWLGLGGFSDGSTRPQLLRASRGSCSDGLFKGLLEAVQLGYAAPTTILSFDDAGATRAIDFEFKPKAKAQSELLAPLLEGKTSEEKKAIFQ